MGDELMRTWDLASVVQHKFGCRLLERVFEHFTASPEASQDLTFYLSSGLFGDVAAHCFHIFGTHVMQHVLEYGTAEQQSLAKSLVDQQVFHKMALSWRGQSAAERVL